MGKVIKKGSADVSSLSVEPTVGDSPVRRAPIIDKNTYEARSEAKEIKERAQQEAEQLLEQARQQAQELQEQAREEGYQTGRSEGVSELSEAVAEASSRLRQVETQLTSQLTQVTIAIARKILGRELQSSPEMVVKIVQNALSEKARQRQEISLRVNPEDFEVIRENKAQLLEVLSRAKEISIREDSEVERFGVVIETDAGTIDAQLDSQLAIFERVLQNLG
tara:strand:- start:85 stop:750 length:666 start_codon:yes stop_codon:yes gene_type:complete